MLAVVPIMVLGLMAGACLVSSAEWKGENPVVMALGAGEEVAAAHAIVTASKIDPDAVTAQNPAVDASIMKEVEKAEKEQARPSVFLPAALFTARKHLPCAHLPRERRGFARSCCVVRGTGREDGGVTSPVHVLCCQADEMDTEKAFAVGNEVVRDDGTGKKLAPAKGAHKDAKTESLVRAVGWKK